MAFKFGTTAPREKNVVANEGLVSRLKYAFTSETKIDAKLKTLIDKLGKVDKKDFAKLKPGITTYQYGHLKQLLNFSEVFVKASEDVVLSIKDILSDKEYLKKHDDPDGDEGDVEGHWMQLTDSIADAGQAIRSSGVSTHKIEALLSKYKMSGKTFGEMGYTPDTIKQIVTQFKKDNDSLKKVTEIISQIDGDLTVGEYIVNINDTEGDDEDAEEAIKRYLFAVSLNKAILKHIDYFLFCVERTIKLEDTATESLTSIEGLASGKQQVKISGGNGFGPIQFGSSSETVRKALESKYHR